MISMRAMWHHFFIEFVCKICFAHFGFNLIGFYFVKGPIKSEHDTLGFDCLTS